MKPKERLNLNLKVFWEKLADEGFQPAVTRRVLKMMPARFYDMDLFNLLK